MHLDISYVKYFGGVEMKLGEHDGAYVAFV